MCSNYPGIKLEPALGTYEDLSSYAHVVHTTAKQAISRRRKNENVFKLSKDEKCTCKACKNTVFHCQICKFVGFLLPSSSWLLKLPIMMSPLRQITVPFQASTCLFLAKKAWKSPNIPEMERISKNAKLVIQKWPYCLITSLKIFSMVI